MEQYRLHRHFLCIDLKSFYASVECALLGLDPFMTPLVVADKSRGNGSIVLAVSPFLKAHGVPSRCRIFELPSDPRIIFAKPRMATYLEFSTRVIEIYLSFVSEDDLFIYSVDEAFLDVTSYLSYYQKTADELAELILAKIRDEVKLYATCGIGPNMLISKLALDIESKKAPNFIARWDYEDIPHKLWPVEPLSEMWGIGHRMEKRLNRLGLNTIGDIAHYNLETLKKLFGILGEELYYHTHGIDMSLIGENRNPTKRVHQASIGNGQMLFSDYLPPDIFLIIREMADDVARRLRFGHYVGRTIHLGISYSKSVGGGFGKQITLDYPTSSASVIYDYCLYLFNQNYEDEPIRRVHISISSLSKQSVYQFSLFEDSVRLEKEHELGHALDEIRMKYGRNSVNRASSELEKSTIKSRNKMIGGHHG